MVSGAMLQICIAILVIVAIYFAVKMTNASDGIKVKYENGKEDVYKPNKLKVMIEQGKQEIVRLNEEKVRLQKVQEAKELLAKNQRMEKRRELEAKDKAEREKKEAQEKADKTKAHLGYLDRSHGDHQGKWEINCNGSHCGTKQMSSYGDHRGKWKTRWTKSNSWTCCEGKDKNDRNCSENPILNWSCCGKDLLLVLLYVRREK